MSPPCNRRYGPMIKIDLPFVFRLGSEIDQLSKLPNDDVDLTEVWFELWGAQATIEVLTTNSLYAPYLRSSARNAQVLLTTLKAHTEKSMEGTKVTHFDLWQIKNSYSEYKIALLAELGTMNSFFVTQKGGFDTTTLLNWGESLFPLDLASKVPEALFDAREAGKCLAYEVPTSAGFHIFRVTESVLRKYHTHVTGGAAPPKVRNIGVYLDSLRRANAGDEKVRAVLKQMADLHRNPIIHPEAVLTMDEAMATAGIARSVVTAMLAVIPKEPPTTSTSGGALSSVSGA